MRKHPGKIPVIDLFAGPGGLGEGFASYRTTDQQYPFKVAASVEMDKFAHQTLELRSFFHEFEPGSAPDEYYSCLRQEITKDELFELFPFEAAAAHAKAIKATLGVPEDDKIIDRKLEDVLAAHEGAPWVLVGGPPCQAYSLIGRSRVQASGAGHESHQKDSRNFLYKQYLRTIAKFKPAIFVMENVKGILSAQVGGEKIFPKILQDLSKPQVVLNELALVSSDSLEYKIYSLVVEKDPDKELKPMEYLIESEKYGVPQARHRVILLGIRSDIPVTPRTLSRSQDKVTVESVLSDMPKLRSFYSKRDDTGMADWEEFVNSIPAQPWFKRYDPASSSLDDRETELLLEHMRLAHVGLQLDLNTGGEFVESPNSPAYKPEWFKDPRLDGVVNHVARGHMKEDLYRYFFASVYSSLFGMSPRMRQLPLDLLPNHKNVMQAINKDIFDDRFRVQEADKPAATITCHIAKDGHYSIHYDPKQCRSLTVREAARIQTFPDNYCFVGPRSQQYKQVGNAVPPILAGQIANIVSDILAKASLGEASVKTAKPVPVKVLVKTTSQNAR